MLWKVANFLTNCDCAIWFLLFEIKGVTEGWLGGTAKEFYILSVTCSPSYQASRHHQRSGERSSVSSCFCLQSPVHWTRPHTGKQRVELMNERQSFWVVNILPIFVSRLVLNANNIKSHLSVSVIEIRLQLDSQILATFLFACKHTSMCSSDVQHLLVWV